MKQIYYKSVCFISLTLVKPRGRPQIMLTTRISIDYNRQSILYLCIYDMTTWAVPASSPVVGSSRNKMAGDVISSMPMLTRLRSPPDTPRINSLPTYTDPNSMSSAFWFWSYIFKHYIACYRAKNILNHHVRRTFCRCDTTCWPRDLDL